MKKEYWLIAEGFDSSLKSDATGQAVRKLKQMDFQYVIDLVLQIDDEPIAELWIVAKTLSLTMGRIIGDAVE